VTDAQVDRRPAAARDSVARMNALEDYSGASVRLRSYRICHLVQISCMIVHSVAFQPGLRQGVGGVFGL
jgi:hypothetical protein